MEAGGGQAAYGAGSKARNAKLVQDRARAVQQRASQRQELPVAVDPPAGPQPQKGALHCGGRKDNRPKALGVGQPLGDDCAVPPRQDRQRDKEPLERALEAEGAVQLPPQRRAREAL